MFQPSEGDIRAFFAGGQKAWVDALVRLAPELTRYYSMEQAPYWRCFAAVIGHESNGLRLNPMRENMHYTTWQRIHQNFKYRLQLCIDKVKRGLEKEPAWARTMTSVQLAQRCVGQPKLLADIVYGGREGTPWMQGSRYIGRDPFQTTHKNNYAKVYAEIRAQPGGAKCPDLVAKPEMLEEPEWGVRAAFAEWKIKRLANYVQDFEALSAVVNTGSPVKINLVIGMEDRKRWYAKALARWPAPQIVEGTRIAMNQGAVLQLGSQGEEVKRLQTLLKQKRYFTGKVDGIYGPLTRDAVVLFQTHHGLKIDGIYGPMTSSVLAEAPPRELPEGRKDITAKELATDRGAKDVGILLRLWNWLRLLFAGNGVLVADQTLDLGILDTAITGAERVRVYVNRGTELALWLPTLPLPTLIVLGTGAVLIALMWAVRKVLKVQVEEAQEGANLAS